MSQFIRKFSVPIFFLLSYIISWTSWSYTPWLLDRYQPLLQGDTPIIVISGIPLILRILFILASIAGVFGPAISATILIAILNGTAGLRKLYAKVFKWRVDPRLYLAVLIIPTLVQFISPVGIGLVSGSSFPDISKYSLLAVLGIFLRFLFINGGQEEIAFRGFAQEKLQVKFGLLKTSVIIGIFWFFWHLPLYVWISSASQFGDNLILSLLNQIAVCFIFTWVYYRTRSIFMAMVLHAMFNFTGFVFSLNLESGSIAFISWVVRIVVSSAIGIFLIWRYQEKHNPNPLKYSEKTIPQR
jgi:membrane protease YdiL (CAAX protease family)